LHELNGWFWKDERWAKIPPAGVKPTPAWMLPPTWRRRLMELLPRRR